MRYESIDKLQKVFAEEIFGHTKDAKKAAGRALGTLVELITFHSLKAWGFEHKLAIERPLAEFANSDITHNVEYSLHPSVLIGKMELRLQDLPLTSSKIAKSIALPNAFSSGMKSNTLLGKDMVLRNACTIAAAGGHFCNAYLTGIENGLAKCSAFNLQRQPYAIFECKRVGVEEGMKKGPQTIEKAKQGAYVARTVSSLQKIRLRDGTLGGVMQNSDGEFEHGDYYELLSSLIAYDKPDVLSRFILTVGVVSNHGNWFTSDNYTKELKVLAQSYDWLLFLTDKGLAQFIEDVIFNPDKEMCSARQAFLESYAAEKKANKFTKVKIASEANLAISRYFERNSKAIDAWFNVISPHSRNVSSLRNELAVLGKKDWGRIHK